MSSSWLGHEVVNLKVSSDDVIKKDRAIFGLSSGHPRVLFYGGLLGSYISERRSWLNLVGQMWNTHAQYRNLWKNVFKVISKCWKEFIEKNRRIVMIKQCFLLYYKKIDLP